MNRLVEGLVLAALAACFAAATANAEPTLRPSAVVQGSDVHLGDLFADAGARAADVVAPAPPPGSRTIFNAAWLAATAHEHGLAWEPASRFDQASVERATRTILADTIAARLLDDISTRQHLGATEIHLDNPALRLVVPAEAPDAIAVEGLTFDVRTGRFSAFVTAPIGSETDRQAVGGRVLRLADIPVPTRVIAPGEAIGPHDVVMIRVPADHVAQDSVTELRELVGKTPRHPLRAHEPIRFSDVQVPVVIHKGDLVTILLETPTMRLSAQGKAMEDGAMNAAIRVANTKSSRVIDAIVTGSNTVAVGNTAQLAAR
ncbi:MAG TPA: flagellar basal body P-ring formation chaperone FlgA [Stellaceae bacterium]|nr:flagellar basal body P-ring formation chaperone FlgA [Stellaceae bacterium]